MVNTLASLLKNALPQNERSAAWMGRTACISFQELFPTSGNRKFLQDSRSTLASFLPASRISLFMSKERPPPLPSLQCNPSPSRDRGFPCGPMQASQVTTSQKNEQSQNLTRLPLKPYLEREMPCPLSMRLPII